MTMLGLYNKKKNLGLNIYNKTGMLTRRVSTTVLNDFMLSPYFFSNK